MRLRQIAPVALVIALTVAGFIVARVLTEHDARRDSERHSEVAAAQIRARVGQAASLTESLRRFMLDSSGVGVTGDQFAKNSLRWLSPADFPAAAWVERVPDSRRAAYERRIGQPIVTPDARRAVVPAGSRSSYLPATLVSGFSPIAVPGIDLSGQPGMAAALARAPRVGGVAATAVASPREGTSGIFLVAPAPNLVGEVLRPGYVVVFVSERTLRGAATDVQPLRITTGGSSDGARERPKTVSDTFTEGGRQFDVVVPREPVQGAAAVLPWIILAAGLGLAALAAALGRNAARRARAQADFDRVFTLSNDLITVADFDGYFTRVNPAAERTLGYTREELLARPYSHFVHPDDREKTAAETASAADGNPVLSFENRYVRKDGSQRVLEWRSTPVVAEGVAYAVARDVTERRQAETAVEHLAETQAALRRVATLIAEEVPRSELFEAVTREAGALLDADFSGMARFEDDDVVTVATWAAAGGHPPVPDRWEMQAGDPATTIARTRAPARWDDWTPEPGEIASFVRDVLGVRSTVGCPIMGEGRVWGAFAIHSKRPAPLPSDTESRLAQFADLVATAIANAEARAEVERLAEEQAALRRIATLVARETSQAEVFTAIAEECGQLFGTGAIGLIRYDDAPSQIVVASSGAFRDSFPVGSRFSLGGMNAASRVFETRRPVRIEDYTAASGAIGDRGRSMGVRSSVATPIMVEGRLWGAMILGTTEDPPLPPATGSRLEQLTDLMATAIANTESKARADRLAEEQTALRRVATLVAAGAAPDAVFDAVTGEMARLLDADQVALNRFEPGDRMVVLAHRGLDVALMPVGTLISTAGQSATAIVRHTGRPARMETYEGAEGALAEVARDTGLRSSVSAPIVVEGRLWGLITASWKGDESPPADTEERMARFAQLLDTAIANADSRDQLTASRVRLLTAGDEARRRVVRDLHDGAQQRLVHTVVTLKLAQRAFRQGDGKAESLVAEALEQAARGNAELRELAHGILPAVLSRGGLRAGVEAFVSRLELPVQVDVPAERFPAEIEASAYFIVAEALTNVVKHAQAARAEARVSVEDGVLRVEVRDYGIGGADPHGHGLVGMADRVTALGGQLKIDSPLDGGTRVAATLPLAAG